MALSRSKEKVLSSNAKPRLALIISENIVNEYINSLEHLLVALVDESIPVALICPRKTRLKLIAPPTVKIITYPRIELPLMEFQNKRLLLKELAEFGPTVIHCFCGKLAEITKWLSRKLKVDYLQTIDSLAFKLKHNTTRSKRCKKLIVPIESIQKNLLKQKPSLQYKIRVVRPGTFVDEKKKCFSVFSQIPSIVITHPMDRIRDFDKVFGAVKHLLIDGYDFMVFIIGGGKEENKIRELIKDLALSPRITIIPKYAPWREVLGVGDIYLQPVPLNRFNPLMLEAMGLGSLVVSCKGGVDDIVIENETAFTFEEDDELSLYSTIRDILNDKIKARKIAADAQHFVRANFSVSKMAEKLIELYRHP